MNIVAKRPSVFLNFEILIKEFLSRYEYSDAFFYYRNQKIFLSKIGYTFLNFPWNWDAVNKWFLEIIPFRSGDEDTSGQFFYDSKNLYSDIDLFYLPLNFFTNDVVYTSNAAATRTANNSTAQIFSIGNEIISYAVDSIAPFPYSSPKPVQIVNGEAKLILKRAPDGIPMPGAYFSIIPYLRDETTCSFEQVLIFAVKYISIIEVKFFTNGQPFIGDNEVEYFEINANYKYFSLNLPKKYRCGEIIVHTVQEENAIDCIFVSSTPLIGNSPIFGAKPKQPIPYKKIFLEDLTFGEFKLNGETIEKSNSSSIRCAVFEFNNGVSQVGKNYGKIVDLDGDTSIFYELFTYNSVGSLIKLTPTDDLTLYRKVWANYKDFTKPFVFGFSSGTSLKMKLDINELEYGEKTEFENTLINVNELGVEFTGFELLTKQVAINSLLDFSYLTFYDSVIFQTDLALSVFEFNTKLFDTVFPLSDKDVTLYDNNPLDLVIRNFKGSIDTYPLIRCNIVAEYMIELNIKNLNEFKFENGALIHPTAFQILSYESKKFSKVSIYVHNPVGWNNENSYSFYSTSAKVYYNKLQWLFQVNSQNVTTVRYEKFVEGGDFRIILSTDDKERNVAVKLFLILE